MTFLYALWGFFVFAGLIFYIFIFPIWMIVHCIRHPNLERNNKVIWVIVMIISWMLGSVLYANFGSKRKLFEWIAVGFFVWGLLFILAISQRN